MLMVLHAQHLRFQVWTSLNMDVLSEPAQLCAYSCVDRPS